MMFEAMAFKFCPLHIKLSTSNFKLKKGLSLCDKPFSWFVARGSWFVARGSWFVARGSWFVGAVPKGGPL